jgi:hypothetical protein
MVKFCHAIGVDYMSSSPFRVPISSPSRGATRHREKGRRQVKGKVILEDSTFDRLEVQILCGQF